MVVLKEGASSDSAGTAAAAIRPRSGMPDIMGRIGRATTETALPPHAADVRGALPAAGQDARRRWPCPDAGPVGRHDDMKPAARLLRDGWHGRAGCCLGWCRRQLPARGSSEAGSWPVCTRSGASAEGWVELVLRACPSRTRSTRRTRRRGFPISGGRATSRRQIQVSVSRDRCGNGRTTGLALTTGRCASDGLVLRRLAEQLPGRRLQRLLTPAVRDGGGPYRDVARTRWAGCRSFAPMAQLAAGGPRSLIDHVPVSRRGEATCSGGPRQRDLSPAAEAGTTQGVAPGGSAPASAFRRPAASQAHPAVP